MNLHKIHHMVNFLLFFTLLAVPAAGHGLQEPVSSSGQSTQSPSQTGTPPLNDRSGIAGTLVLPDQDYRIGPGDVIGIQVDDAPELSGIFRVNAAGTISIPYLGKIDTGKKTAEELAGVIADGLRGRYLKNPKVTILIRESNSSAFYMLGAVGKPGIFQVQGKPSMLKMLTLAGGLAENHGTTAFVIRELRSADQTPAPAGNSAGPPPEHENGGQQEEPTPPLVDANYQLITVNINGLLRGRFEQNMMLEPGDIINIPATDVFFVSGEVKGAGSFPLKEGTTLRQAISIAQGMTFRASPGHGIIFREDQATGKREEIRVDIGAVMKGKKDDIRLAANDIIIVPSSAVKTVGAPMLQAFATFGLTSLLFR
ncbi:MAG: polysaccharide biosynthesis/export family protein [Acidobacteria bacterium]|nr:polysaccharide biosynthesis/export family protein [Acidobacteriota bacterium]